MKKWLKLFGIMLIGALVLIMAGTVCQSCDQFTKNKGDSDSVKFEQLLEEHLPIAMQNIYVFDDVTDAVIYKNERLRQLEFDSIFTHMSDQQLANVISVVLKSQRRCSVSDIVYEYKSNKRIYDGLPSEQYAALPEDVPIKDTTEVKDSATIPKYRAL